MLIQLHEAGTGLIEIVPSLPGASQLSKLVADKSFTATGNNAHGFFEFFGGHGFYFAHSKYNAKRNCTWSASGDDRATELRFMLGRPLRGTWHGMPGAELLRDQFSLCSGKDTHTEVDFTRADDYETLDAHYELSYLERLAPDFPLLDAFVNKIHAGSSLDASARKYYCTPGMQRIIYRLLNNPFDALRQKYMLESAARDLLLEALFEIHELRAGDIKVQFTPFEIEVIFEAKRKIDNDDFAEPLNKLLANSGVSDHRFNAGFKKYIGTTPYQYHMDHKFSVAAHRLITTNLSVTEIALSLNYGSPANFTIEFTKRFKYPPLEYRRRFK